MSQLTDISLTHIREVLEPLYDDADALIRLAEDAGLSRSKIEIHRKSVNFLHEILREAKKRNKVLNIIDVAIKNYGETTEELLSAKLHYIAEPHLLDTEVIDALYYKCVPPTFNYDPPPEKNFRNRLRDLWEMPEEIEKRPILKFAQLLTDRASDLNTRKLINDWIREAVKCIHPKLTPNEVGQIMEKLASAVRTTDYDRTGIHHLLVLMQPDPNDRVKNHLNKRYHITFIDWKNQKQNKVINTTIIKLKEVPHRMPILLSEAIENILRSTDTDVDLHIEFFLPFELLLEPIDKWTDHTSPLGGVTIGMSYPLVVRSLKRVTQPSSLNKLRKRWKQVSRSNITDITGETHWIRHIDEFDVFELAMQLSQTPSVICACHCHVCSVPDKRFQKYFDTMLYTGIPIAIWPRETGVGNLENELQALLTSQNLRKLPLEVRTIRRKATAGNHLTVLLDNPERIPGALFQPLRAL